MLKSIDFWPLVPKKLSVESSINDDVHQKSMFNVLHFSAPPRTYLVRATPPLSPDWRHCIYYCFGLRVAICKAGSLNVLF